MRVDDTPQHRAWLERIATDVAAAQDDSRRHPRGGRRRRPRLLPAARLQRQPTARRKPRSSTPNGDPVADLLYTCNFAFLGLHEAAVVYPATRATGAW